MIGKHIKLHNTTKLTKDHKEHKFTIHDITSSQRSQIYNIKSLQSSQVHNIPSSHYNKFTD
jgi:Spy/CpxP family protein refolding chaperone